MNTSNYDSAYGANDRAFLGPFLMGVAVGIGCAAMYAMGRRGTFGEGIASGVQAFEGKAVDIKDKVVEKAGQVKEAVATRFGGADGQVAEEMTTPASGKQKQAQAS